MVVLKWMAVALSKWMVGGRHCGHCADGGCGGCWTDRLAEVGASIGGDGDMVAVEIIVIDGWRYRVLAEQWVWSPKLWWWCHHSLCAGCTVIIIIISKHAVVAVMTGCTWCHQGGGDGQKVGWKKE